MIVQVVHVINTSNHSVSSSYVSLASVTMGRLDEEARVMNDTGLFCGESDGPDFASYVVRCNSRAILVDLVHWDSINMVISENYFIVYI